MHQSDICEALGFTPVDGKVCFNAIPNVIADKFKSNPALFLEFKRLLSQKKEVASNKLWTFPQFKV